MVKSKKAERLFHPEDRIYHHYESLEEYHAGMWRIIRGEERKRMVEASAALMRDPPAFKEAMGRAAKEWTNSCEANLTAEAVNRIAWLGHAGCCIATGSPEDCTMAGWHTLSKPEQDEANRVAAEVLAAWERWLAPKPAKLQPDLFLA